MDCLHPRSYGPIRVLFLSLLWLVIRRSLWPVFLHSSTSSGTKRAPLPGVLLCCSACHAQRGAAWLGSYSRSVCQSLKGAPWVGSRSVVQCVRVWPASLSIVQLLMLACRERGYGDGSIHYTWLGSITLLPWLHGFPPWTFPTTISSPITPQICLSTYNSSPCPRIAPQPLNSSSQLLRLPGDPRPCPGYVWLWQRLSDSHSIYAVTDQLTLSHKCFSSDSDNCPNAGIRLLLQFPHQPGAGPINTCFSP